jgi:hypothetical protein
MFCVKLTRLSYTKKGMPIFLVSYWTGLKRDSFHGGNLYPTFGCRFQSYKLTKEQATNRVKEFENFFLNVGWRFSLEELQ